MSIAYEHVRLSSRERSANVPRAWSRRYRSILTASDLVATALAVAGATAISLTATDAVLAEEITPQYLWLASALIGAWMGALTLAGTRDRRVLGYGPREYVLVVTASWHLFAALAIVSFVLNRHIDRSYLFLAAPLGTVFLLGTRYLLRQSLHRRRARGLDKSPVIVVGPIDKAATLIDEFHHEPSSEFHVVGVCVPRDSASGAPAEVAGVPVLGTAADAARIAASRDVFTVAVAGADAITSKTVRQLGWELEGTGIDLALTTTLIDVAGPRVMLGAMNSMPLLYVDEASFTGPKYWAKSVFDRVLALVITLVLLPVLVLVAILVKVTSPGPVLFVQQRIGLNGTPFGMLKFRSMVVGAADQLAAVLEAEGAGEVGMFYKPTNDPRVTPLGRFIRKYSLDELPQLLNVLRGDMSLVGPRPQIADEVAQYDRAASRRLLVKPGLTGLWQVSGRSGLGPEESIRLDLRYAENWSMVGDLAILARTVKVVVLGDNAR